MNKKKKKKGVKLKKMYELYAFVRLKRVINKIYHFLNRNKS